MIQAAAVPCLPMLRHEHRPELASTCCDTLLAAGRLDLENVTIQELLQKLSLSTGSSPASARSPSDQTPPSATVASNPLYNTPGERTASPTEGSQTASNGFMRGSACLRSVSTRPLSNPLFDPQDSASCRQVLLSQMPACQVSKLRTL